MNLVEKDCLEALVGHDIPKAQEHLGTLSKIGKVDDVVRQFVERSIPKVASNIFPSPFIHDQSYCEGSHTPSPRLCLSHIYG